MDVNAYDRGGRPSGRQQGACAFNLLRALRAPRVRGPHRRDARLMAPQPTECARRSTDRARAENWRDWPAGTSVC